MVRLLLPPLGPGAALGVAVPVAVVVVRACMRIQPSSEVEARREGDEREKDRDVMRSACEVESATEPEVGPRWLAMVSVRVPVTTEVCVVLYS